MPIDFSQKERAFVAELATDTGRDLDAWMAAITDAGLSHRNEIIDWLRQNGFTFARASWIERIHHNGGKLIYASDTRSPAEAHRRKMSKPQDGKAAFGAALADAKPADIKTQTRAPASKTALQQADGEIDSLLAAAKAYRPLAQVLLRDVLGCVPGADVRASRGYIVTSHERPFAALLAGPKDVRLLLALGSRVPGEGWARMKTAPGLDSIAALTHMLVLTDARQLTPALRELIAASASETGELG